MRGEMESAAVSDPALDPDRSAQKLDQTRGDGQAKSGAPGLSRRGAVALDERVKDEGLLLFRNSNPRIGDYEMDDDDFFFALGFVDSQHNFPFISEFDGVADQIHDHLPKPV